MWIFGYGSLIWKIDFPYEVKLIGHVKGYERKFYQLSTDHRGTPEKPGRVVTLLPSHPSSEVWGVAYKIRDEDVEAVLEHLDYREKGGYERVTSLFYPKGIMVKPFGITIYIGTIDNKNYAGDADECKIAEQIVDCGGSSGTNIEYVCRLASAMRKIAPNVEDTHLFHIEKEVLKISKSCVMKSTM